MPANLNSIMCLGLAMALGATGSVRGQEAYPAKPIRIIVPFAPGGPNDIISRLVGKKLFEKWGQQVIVDSRPGGNTVIGSELAASSNPDGYTLLIVSTSTTVNPSLMKKLPYDTLKDFASVVRLTASPNILVTPPSLPVTSVRELIAMAKAKPGEINFSSGGSGSSTHLTAELFCLTVDAKMNHVPYKGAGPATIALLGAEVTWMFGTTLPTMPHIKSGRLRAIGVSGLKRSPVMPDIPAIAETLPGFEATSWYGVSVPARTPKPVIAKLNDAIARILDTAEMRDRLLQDGTEAIGGTTEEFSAYFKAEIVKWDKVIRAAGIKPN